MQLELARIEDLDSVISFYEYVTEHTPDIAAYAQWRKGKYPTAEGLETFVREGSLYLYKEDVLVGAMALTMYQEAQYHPVAWAIQVPDDEVAVIHILAVSPDKQGAGIGAEMVREAIRIAREKGMRTSSALRREHGLDGFPFL